MTLLATIAALAACASSADSKHPQSQTPIATSNPGEDAADRKTIDALKAGGSDIGKATDVRHYLFLPTADTAASAKKELETLGYRTETAPPDDKSTSRFSSYYELRASIAAVPSIENIRAERLVFENLASEYGGSYSGWKARIVR